MIDWEWFGSHVAKTTIRWQSFNQSFNGGYWQEGMLLELAPYTSTEVTSRYGDAVENSQRLLCQCMDKPLTLRISVTSMQFLIDEQWLNFWQLMTRA